jgi:hypothetical protein
MIGHLVGESVSVTVIDKNVSVNSQNLKQLIRQKQIVKA